MAGALTRWLAAIELIRAHDKMRELTEAGRVTQADMDRLHQANLMWDAAR